MIVALLIILKLNYYRNKHGFLFCSGVHTSAIVTQIRSYLAVFTQNCHYLYVPFYLGYIQSDQQHSPC